VRAAPSNLGLQRREGLELIETDHHQADVGLFEIVIAADADAWACKE
jgi:hypothetical protein